MNNKSTLQSLALEVHELLNGYVDLHDEIHKAQASFLSVIMRTFGKNISYDELYKKTCALEVALLGMQDDSRATKFESPLSNDEEPFFLVLTNYIGCVREAVTKLKERQAFLLEMSNGVSHSFTQLSEYESNYKVAVQAYKAEGHRLKHRYEKLLTNLHP